MSALKTCINCTRWYKSLGTAALGGTCGAGGQAAFRSVALQVCTVRHGDAFDPVARLILANCTINLRVITPVGAIAKIVSVVRDFSVDGVPRVGLKYLYEDEQGTPLPPQFLREYKGKPVRFKGEPRE